jgi:hypothetical protein
MPLREALPTSLQELFDRDPERLNDDDIDQLVAFFRAQREQWSEREAKAKRGPAKVQSAASLEDLGL